MGRAVSNKAVANESLSQSWLPP
ncbi:hypothetical protein YPPY98_1794, partial [Yersinia pestis PY-98]